MPPPSATPRTWTRDGFLISTDPSLIPLSTLNAAFAAPWLYWAKPLPEPVLRDMLDNSLSFGLYSPTSSLPPQTATPDAADLTPREAASETLHEIAGHVHPHPSVDAASPTAPAPAQPRLSSPPSSTSSSSSSPALIGFARCITDHITFLYLTDVYILPTWQGQGLGSWLMGCVREVVDAMPHLRRVMAIIGGADGPDKSTEGWYERMLGMGALGKGKVISRKGPGNVF